MTAENENAKEIVKKAAELVCGLCPMFKHGGNGVGPENQGVCYGKPPVVFPLQGKLGSVEGLCLRAFSQSTDPMCGIGRHAVLSEKLGGAVDGLAGFLEPHVSAVEAAAASELGEVAELEELARRDPAAITSARLRRRLGLPPLEAEAAGDGPAPAPQEQAGPGASATM